MNRQRWIIVALGCIAIVIITILKVPRAPYPDPGAIIVVDDAGERLEGVAVGVQTSNAVVPSKNTDAVGIVVVDEFTLDGEPQFLLLSKPGFQDRIVPWPTSTPIQFTLEREQAAATVGR